MDLLTVAMLAIECLEDQLRAAGRSEHVVLAREAAAAIERLADGACDSYVSRAVASVHHIRDGAGQRRSVAGATKAENDSTGTDS